MELPYEAFGLAGDAALAVGLRHVPLTRTHAGPAEPPVPAPTAERPDAYNYLPAVMGGECSEAEYPLFARLDGQPLEQVRPLLETLGIIRDHKLVPFGNAKADQGWMQAINERQRLSWTKAFATPEGPRIAWLFIGGSGGGNQGQRAPATAIISNADNRVITFKPTKIWMAFELRPVALAYPDATVLEVANRFVAANRNAELTPDVIRFSAAGIEVESRGAREGFGIHTGGRDGPTQ